MADLGYKTPGVSGGRPTFELLGNEELARALVQMGEEIIDEIEGIALEAAEPLLDEIRSNAPWDSGEMALSLDLFKLKPKGNLTAVVAVGPHKDYYYWLFNEMGAQPHEIPRPKAKGVVKRIRRALKGKLKHPGVTAKPFIRPAYDKLEEQILGDIAAGINKILERHFGTK